PASGDDHAHAPPSRLAPVRSKGEIARSAVRDAMSAPVPPFTPLPCRPLGRTGREVTIFGLGGEGVLRTFGRKAEAVRVIQRALDQGVNYFDTAPAYAEC